MGSGDKVYIADKETLDKVKASADSIWAYLIGTLTSAISIIQTEASDTKTTVTSHNSDMSSRVGESSNDGSAATLFGRLQKIINLVDSVGDYVSSIDSNTRTIQGDVSEDGHIGLTLGTIWTYISTQLPHISSQLLCIKDQVAPGYNPDAQGTISQMLSYIIQNMVSTSRFPKAYRSLKKLLTGSNTVLDITGAGIFYGSMANLYDVAYASAIKVTIDGVAYDVTPKSGCTYLCRSFDGAGTPISMSTYDMFQISAPIHFNESLKIELTISGEFSGVEYARTIYDLYK